MANRSLGTLTLDLITKTGAYVQGWDKAERVTAKRVKAIKRQFKGLTDSAKRYSKIAAGALAAGVGVATVIVNRTRDQIDAQAKLAQSLNTTINGLQNVTRAGELAGVAFTQVEQATKDFSRRISQAADGTGPAVAALERLNLTAEDLFNLPLDDRIETVNRALLDFVPAAERAAVAGQLFGEEGSLNILRITPDNIARARREVELFGAALTDVEAAQVENANDALSSLSLITKGIAQRLTVEVVPFLEAAVVKITELVEEAGGLGPIVSDVFDRMISGGVTTIAIIREPLVRIQQIVQSLWEGFQQLPRWVQEIGIVGAIVGGRTGKIALGGIALFGEEISGFINNIRAELAYIEQQEADGVSLFRQFFPKKEDFEEFKKGYLAELEASGDNGGSLFTAAFGDPEGLAGDEYLQSLRAFVDEIRRISEEGGRAAVQARETANNAPVLPSVPGADATFPASEGALIIKDFINGKAEVKEATDEMSQYAISAARNMQSAFADFLFDPFEGGLDGMLKSFATTLQRMAAEAAAAEIFDSLFKESAGGLGGFLGGLFGGGKAAGGPVFAGRYYEVGEANQPEIFRTGGRQYLIPGNQGEVSPVGGAGVVQNFNIATPDADSFRASQKQIARVGRRGLGL